MPCFIFFCLGIVAESYQKFSFEFLAVLLSIFVILLIFSLESRKSLAMFIPIFLLGSLIFANSKILPSSSIARLTPVKKEIVILRGIVLSDPASSREKKSFILGVSRISHGTINKAVRGKVFIKGEGISDIFYGDELLIEGGLYRPGGYTDYLKSKGIYSILNARGAGAVKRTGRTKGNALIHWALFLKHKMEVIISFYHSSFSAGILRAMLLGEANEVPPAAREMMVKTGTWHVMVVSGSNTGLVALILLILFKLMRLPRKVRFGLIIFLLIIYCFLTGASSPVVRATVMAVVFLISFSIERNPLFYNSLSLAGLVILGLDPGALFDVGFQLSFASVFFILWLYPKINGFIIERISVRRNEVWGRALESAVGCFCVSLSAWLGTAPLIAYVFGNFSLITVLANMAVVPLAMLVTSVGFSLIGMSFILPPFARLIALCNDFLIYSFLKINLIFSKFPFASLNVISLPLAVVFAYYAFIFVFFSMFFKKPQAGGRAKI